MANQTPTDTSHATATLTHAELSQFIGDLERYFRPYNRKVLYTPGVKFLESRGLLVDG